MRQEDLTDFIDSWLHAHANSAGGKEPAHENMLFAFELLQGYEFDAVIYAIKKHCSTNKFPPTPADVIDIIKRRTGSKHMSADEAWALVDRSMDESLTVFLTEQMMAARAEVCELYRHDAMAARMAFRSAYERVLGETDDNPRWVISLGTDANLRREAIEYAARSGMITQQRAALLLPSSQDGGPIAGLLTGKVQESEIKDESLKSRWKEIRAMLGPVENKKAGEFPVLLDEVTFPQVIKQRIDIGGWYEHEK